MSEDGREPFVGKITQKAILFGPDGDVLVTGSDETPEPPGGTFEFGETLVDGLRRELQEELGIDARVGPPVETLYGGWADDSGTPMVALVYRCETDEREVTLNEEHEFARWVAPEEAAQRFGAVIGRLEQAVRRAEKIENSGPFTAVADPYADSDTTSEEVVAALEAARTDDG
ncbi:NUDIX domain-containing protein [Halolamina salina]|uniref:NUDIX domain-containing protein n=1 Tax=Halolamina salina TaxID=1220023 RepID=A0ABD6B7C4_9EURY